MSEADVQEVVLQNAKEVLENERELRKLRLEEQQALTQKQDELQSLPEIKLS
jgi:hypothetical protein